MRSFAYATGILILFAGSPVLAQTAPSPAASPVRAAVVAPAPTTDEIEEVDDVVEVATPQASAGKVPGGLADLLGRLHPAVVHLPIAWLLLLFLMDFLAFALHRESCRRCGLAILLLTVLSCVPTLASGFLRAGQMDATPEMLETIETHEQVMLAVTGIALAALVVRLARRDRLEGAWKAIYLVLVAAAAGLVGLGGHIGGRIVYGKDFLPF